MSSDFHNSMRYLNNRCSMLPDTQGEPSLSTTRCSVHPSMYKLPRISISNGITLTKKMVLVSTRFGIRYKRTFIPVPRATYCASTSKCAFMCYTFMRPIFSWLAVGPALRSWCSFYDCCSETRRRSPQSLLEDLKSTAQVRLYGFIGS